MIPIKSLSVLEISGLDAGQFLHNQLSADILGILPGSAGFACFCNPAGRVIALLLVFRSEGTFYVVCSRDLAEPLQSWLSRFIIRAKVEIRISTDLTVVGLDNPSVNEQTSEALVISATTGSGLTYGIARQSAHEDPLAQKVWQASELKAGVIWLGSDTSAQFLPQMLGFEKIGALSFNKGCYPGQEIIARTRYLGKLKRRPLLLSVNQDFSVDIMGKVDLWVGENRFSAVVVDQAETGSTGQTLFVVARMGAETTPDLISSGELESPVLPI
jgi:folate-binding protein YgfZ